jgi:hypothetical protein
MGIGGRVGSNDPDLEGPFELTLPFLLTRNLRVPFESPWFLQYENNDSSAKGSGWFGEGDNEMASPSSVG